MEGKYPQLDGRLLLKQRCHEIRQLLHKGRMFVTMIRVSSEQLETDNRQRHLRFVFREIGQTRLGGLEPVVCPPAMERQAARHVGAALVAKAQNEQT